MSPNHSTTSIIRIRILWELTKWTEFREPALFRTTLKDSGIPEGQAQACQEATENQRTKVI